MKYKHTAIMWIILYVNKCWKTCIIYFVIVDTFEYLNKQDIALFFFSYVLKFRYHFSLLHSFVGCNTSLKRSLIGYWFSASMTPLKQSVSKIRVLRHPWRVSRCTCLARLKASNFIQTFILIYFFIFLPRSSREIWLNLEKNVSSRKKL